MTNTITMNGNSTGYGMSSGSEIFDLYGKLNTVLLGGADDTINFLGSSGDVVDLNYTGFTNAVTDTISLGRSGGNHIKASSALTNSSVTIIGQGVNNVAFVNHDGTNNITLGYGHGDPALQGTTANHNVVSLNGDASNTVSFTAGGAAQVTIGSTGDGFDSYASSISLVGHENVVNGGDENFTITDPSGELNTISLGNGDDTVSLAGDKNTVSLGNGDNSLALSGFYNIASFGTGNNSITSAVGHNSFSFATGGAGSTDTLSLVQGGDTISGGDENFNISGDAHGGRLIGAIGDGNNTINLSDGHAKLTIGDSTANSGQNSVTLGHSGNNLTFNGGTDQITLNDRGGAGGYDKVTLNGTMLGTSLTTQGVFENVTLTQDASAAITDGAVNGGLSLTLDADATGGFGNITVSGLSTDDLAQISLVNASTYTMTTDNTPMGGVTLHFDHGTLDLIGLQSVPNNLFT